VTPDDAKWALIVYSPDIATLKGKAVKRQNKGIPRYQAIQILDPIINKYREVWLFIDIFWVNGSPYFHTILEWIKFCTVAPINNIMKRTLLMEAQAVINMYLARGFNISRVKADREFVCITNDILPINLNAANAGNHLHEVEQSIRTVKERT
jgi:hypothetical protein